MSNRRRSLTASATGFRSPGPFPHPGRTSNHISPEGDELNRLMDGLRLGALAENPSCPPQRNRIEEYVLSYEPAHVCFNGAYLFRSHTYVRGNVKPLDEARRKAVSALLAESGAPGAERVALALLHRGRALVTFRRGGRDHAESPRSRP